MTKTNRPFNKTYNTPAELVKLLQSRGLSIRDTNLAAHYIQNIGYYRLSAYMYPLLSQPKIKHLYKKRASFDQVMMLYRFDKKLRILIFNEIEKIEVAFRSAVVNMGCELTGDPFWITKQENFRNVNKSPNNDMTRKLKTLLSDFPNVDPAAMGFSHNWEKEPVWKYGSATYDYRIRSTAVWYGYLMKNKKMMAVMLCKNSDEHRYNITISSTSA